MMRDGSRVLAGVMAFVVVAGSLAACDLASAPRTDVPNAPPTGAPSTGAAPAASSAGSPRESSPAGTRTFTGDGSSGGGIGGIGGGRPVAGGGMPERLGPTDAATVIDFSLLLRVLDPSAVDAYLAGLYDPASPNYHRFLSAAQFGERFGLPLDRIAQVQDWAHRAGLTIVQTYAQRTAIRLRAPAATVNSLFDVTLMDEHDPVTGETYSVLDAQPSVPQEIVADVDAVAGLDDRPAVSFAVPSGVESAAIPRGGLGPRDLAAAYDINPLYDAGVFGTDQYIAIISFDTYKPSDIEVFEQELGIVDAPPIERIAVGRPLEEPGPGSGEVTLDIDVVRAVAPRARILNFEAPNNGSVGFAEMVDAIIEDGRAQIISVSWGLCEPNVNPTARLRGERAFQAMAAAGISLFAADGDWGAYSCSNRDPADHRVEVFWPASSPYVVSVGGTYLSVREDGTYLDEAGWEDYLSTSGTGGGLNPVDPRPDWQQGVGVDNADSNGARQLPDVAAAADPDTGYAVYYTVEAEGGDGWTVVGGTSGAAPFWAAITALFGEVNMRAGVGRTGFLNPMLYAIAASAEPNTVFNDIVRGGNLLHRAGPGWDYATGLGSPNVTALAAAIVEYLRANPAP